MSTQTKGFWNKEFIISIVAAGGVIFSIIFSAISIQMTNDEIECRMRPWVGITDVSFEAAPTASASGIYYISISFDNVGALPAQNLKFVQVSLEVPLDKRGPNDEPIVWSEEVLVGVVFPREATKQSFDFKGDRMINWRSRKLPLIFQGMIIYEYQGMKYNTTFEAELHFENDLDSPDIYWANKGAQ